MITTEALTVLAGKQEIDVVLRDQHPIVQKYRLVDASSKNFYDIIVRCRRMGEDNGKDQLVRVTDYLHRITEYVRQTARKLSPEEKAGVMKIISSG
jgi:hypothetical protein